MKKDGKQVFVNPNLSMASIMKEEFDISHINEHIASFSIKTSNVLTQDVKDILEMKNYRITTRDIIKSN